jgi:hypothetical protein
MIDDERSEIRERVVKALLVLQPELLTISEKRGGCLEKCIGFFQDKDPMMRVMAAFLVGRMTDFQIGRYSDQLVAQLNDPEASVRVTSIQTIAKMLPQDVLPISHKLVLVLLDKNKLVRSKLVKMISKDLDNTAQLKCMFSLLRVLFDPKNTDTILHPSTSTRKRPGKPEEGGGDDVFNTGLMGKDQFKSAMRLLKKMDKNVQLEVAVPLFKKCASANPIHRQIAIHVLKNLESSAQVACKEHILKQLSHPEPSIRSAAAKVFELVSHELQLACTDEVMAMLSSEVARERKGGLVLLNRMDLHTMKESKHDVRAGIAKRWGLENEDALGTDINIRKDVYKQLPLWIAAQRESAATVLHPQHLRRMQKLGRIVISDGCHEHFVVSHTISQHLLGWIAQHARTVSTRGLCCTKHVVPHEMAMAIQKADINRSHVYINTLMAEGFGHPDAQRRPAKKDWPAGTSAVEIEKERELMLLQGGASGEGGEGEGGAAGSALALVKERRESAEGTVIGGGGGYREGEEDYEEEYGSTASYEYEYDDEEYEEQGLVEEVCTPVLIVHGEHKGKQGRLTFELGADGQSRPLEKRGGRGKQKLDKKAEYKVVLDELEDVQEGEGERVLCMGKHLKVKVTKIEVGDPAELNQRRVTTIFFFDEK